MRKRALIIKKRLGIIIFSVLLMIFTSVMAYAGEGRFVFSDLTATDKITGLMWTKDGNIAKKELAWKEAFKLIKKLNKQKYAGYSDRRLSKIEELEILLDYAKKQGYKKHHSDFFLVKLVLEMWNITTGPRLPMCPIRLSHGFFLWTTAKWAPTLRLICIMSGLCGEGSKVILRHFNNG